MKRWAVGPHEPSADLTGTRARRDEDAMRKLIVSEFMSLDGVMQAPGGKDEDRDGGFEHGGWTWPYWHDDIGKRVQALLQDSGSTHVRDTRRSIRAHGIQQPVR